MHFHTFGLKNIIHVIKVDIWKCNNSHFLCLKSGSKDLNDCDSELMKSIWLKFTWKQWLISNCLSECPYSDSLSSTTAQVSVPLVTSPDPVPPSQSFPVLSLLYFMSVVLLQGPVFTSSSMSFAYHKNIIEVKQYNVFILP